MSELNKAVEDRLTALERGKVKESATNPIPVGEAGLYYDTATSQLTFIRADGAVYTVTITSD